MTDQLHRIVTGIVWGVILVGAGLIAWQLITPATASQTPIIVTAPTVPVHDAHAETLDEQPDTPLSQVFYITGAVNVPGVYAFETQHDVRVVDVVLRAGGLSADADATAINLAATIDDATHVHVPSRMDTIAQPVPARIPEQDTSALVNLNTASVAELTELPGVGPALAQRIIDYREQHGAYTSLADLDAVSGVGQSLLEKISAHVEF
ncbi:MAG: ComEA family DNA-binding protein [Chloroflexi bacterium]|nr:ComEA family DNA-binding protein [Chloroflexota bacterium]